MTLLVLGGSSKVGTLLQQVWDWRRDVLWQSRTPEPWAQIIWDGTGALPDMPPFDAVLALWGVTDAQDDLALNTTLGLRAIEVAERIGAGRVLLCSSGAVYPKSDAPHFEDGPVGPFTDYGQSKLDMERAVAGYSGAVETCLMRISNVLGADSLWPAIVSGQVTLDQFADGHGPLRSYVTPRDLSLSIAALLEVEELPKCVNIASHPAVYMEDLALASGAELSWQDAPDTATARVVMDTALLQSLVKLQPKTAAQMILDRTR